MRYNFAAPLKNIAEDEVWSDWVVPKLVDMPENVINACQYGVTEIINNAIDHSGSLMFSIILDDDADALRFTIQDYGVGIFTKIQKDLGLEFPQQSLLELAKGKCTTDPTRHTGEGIFFTSRIFDDFYIISRKLSFMAGRNNKLHFLFEDSKDIEGTYVVMKISKKSDVKTSEIFNSFTAANDENFGFSKTYIPINLAACEGNTLISRSQAKRILTRVDKFKEVIFDFNGIEEVGQGFADEVFRVFRLAHSEVELFPINMSENVEKMVKRAQSLDQ